VTISASEARALLGRTRFRIDPLRERCTQDLRLSRVFDEEVLVDAAVVVIVVATARSAAVEGEPLMGGPLLSDLLVTAEAVVTRQTQAHLGGAPGSVLDVTRQTRASVELGDAT